LRQQALYRLLHFTFKKITDLKTFYREISFMTCSIQCFWNFASFGHSIILV